MYPHLAVALLAVLLVTSMSSGGNEKGPRLESRIVRVKLEQPIRAKDGTAFVELLFANATDKPQKFENSEYRFTILDTDGKQVSDQLFLTAEVRTVVLKGKMTAEKQSAHVVNLNAGQEYFLVVSVRNAVGMVRFRAE